MKKRMMVFQIITSMSRKPASLTAAMTGAMAAAMAAARVPQRLPIFQVKKPQVAM